MLLSLELPGASASLPCPSVPPCCLPQSDLLTCELLRGFQRCLALLESNQQLSQEVWEDRAKEAATRLETALAAGYGPANLHLAHLAFDAGVEDRALAHLKDYLSRLVARGRDRCDGCSQKRGEDAPMLTCRGCRVARFCY